MYSAFSRAQLTVTETAYDNDDQTVVDDGIFVPEDWEYTNNGIGCTITKYVGPGEKVIIPRKIDGCPVIAIADHAFAGNEEITEVEMRDGIISIGTEAFYECSNLTSINIPGSVMQMGDYIFQRCTNLSHVTLGEGITRLGDTMFVQCWSLQELQIPETVSVIGAGALDFTGLKNIDIPANVTLIETSYFGFFTYSSSLKAINVSPENSVYQSIDGVLFSKDGKILLCYPSGRSGTYEIPENTIRIGRAAFYACKKIGCRTDPGECYSNRS